ncbi:ethanolamine ammonia-lyase subunit EutC [Atlantibacter subterranea]|uniref:Ethanolamine ammonia-lyase small subunit n=1 Tax=Atlantibacter subterraneus TaxID=255519 RepID=A0A427UXY2_9ENTR|nr:ethanolamine ammonia-lyase subunit EutC [Atlantibacter subterranea]MDZ5668654.1 ethanolamine ammonia-lyase subunit EutC [Atlantibacter hermannii]MDA3133140.1 ethanolamine ammonia-lyase subunit EutC [Atlantibacter subterranea]MDV7025473.1 ethanolamine ammonia-lyase subunit EutC [Atlantibacter subterranea]RSB65449.1 ethanolamine ammonia-lyase subunit EutC [Atlantibacter subterranea]RSE08495.1 ethanolamine ammonia-lyase subunit EutC [Atlantibacter subterranea]
MHAPDAWKALNQFTDARIALGRSGASLPTAEVLKFGLAHAQARDAIHQPFDSDTLAEQLAALDLETLTVHSQATDRPVYLNRPDLGRRLDEPSRERLTARRATPHDVLLVIGDGLSSHAVQRQAVPLVKALLPFLATLGLSTGPVVLAHQSRVALGDDIGECLNSKAVAMLIGERPGLSSPDSLGVYLTWKPERARIESERNCISNIRPEGLGYDAAAFKLAWLLEQAFLRRLTGVNLKDESDNPALWDKVRPGLARDDTA